MRKLASFSIKISILLLIIEVIGCSGAKSQLRGEMDGETFQGKISQEEMKKSQSEMATPSSQLETPVAEKATMNVAKAGKVSEVEEVEKEKEIIKKKAVISAMESKKEEVISPLPPVTASTQAVFKKAKKIIDFSLDRKEDHIAFNIIADGKFEKYDSFRLDSPARLVLDIWEVSTSSPKKSIKIENPFIKQVRIGHYQDKLRLVFDPIKPQLPQYQIHQMDDKLIVYFGNVSQLSELQILPLRSSTQTAFQTSNPPQPSTPATSPPQPLPTTTPPQPGTPPPSTFPTTTQPPTATPSQPSTTPTAPPITPPTPPAPAAPSPPRRAAELRAGSGVVFNFDNADLYEVIRVMAEILKINYLIDPKVKGVVNIHTAGQISTEDVFPIFQSILKMSGAMAVKKDNLYEIVPFSDAKKLYIPPSTLQEPEKIAPEMKYMIQIIPLKYIPVTEVSKMIKPFLSDAADIVEHPAHNILILGDVASNIKKSLDIIALFDIDIFTDLRVRIYPILNADVTEIGKEMERIFSSFEISLKSGRGVGITFTPVTRINSLLVVSSIPNIFEKVEGWLKELDKTPMETKFGVFVYYVQNSKAKDLAEVLKQIYVTTKEKKPEFKEKVTTPEQPALPRSAKPPPSPPSPTPKEEPGAAPEGEINIVVDETTNALVVRAFARDYKSILETIKKLDLYPKQVLIEVMLAQITLDESTKFGIEWSRFLSSGVPESHAQEVVVGARPPAAPFSQALASIGARYSIVDLGGRVSAAISAAAADNRLNVISSPHILASNNKEAKIQIGKSQPILTNTYTTTATTSPGVVEGTIEYKDIGIILTVTPRISDSGLITLELQIEKSDVSNTQLGNLPSVPVFDKKTAKTVLSVLEEQMIVIGGLIEDTKKRNKAGIPFLSKIPLLGALFGTHEFQDVKTELVLLMTPHIITDTSQSQAVTQEFREKIEKIKKELELKEKEREKKK